MNTKELCEQLAASTSANFRDWLMARLETDIVSNKLSGDPDTIVAVCMDCYFKGVEDSAEHWLEHFRNLGH